MLHLSHTMSCIFFEQEKRCICFKTKCCWRFTVQKKWPQKDTTVLGRIISVSRDYTANSVCAINVVAGQEHGSFQKLFFRNGVSQESRTILEKRKALAGTVWSLDIENPRATGLEPQQRHVILIVIRSQPCLRLWLSVMEVFKGEKC